MECMQHLGLGHLLRPNGATGMNEVLYIYSYIFLEDFLQWKYTLHALTLLFQSESMQWISILAEGS